MRLQFEEIKNVLKSRIDNLTLNNFVEESNRIRGLLDVASTLSSLDLLEDALISSNTINTTEIEEEIVYKRELRSDVPGHIFKKSVVGGVLIGIDDYFVPELTVRYYGLESGDLVQLINREKNEINILERQKESIQDDYILYKYCIVKKDASILYCDESLYGGGNKLIKLDEVPYKFVIQSHIAEKFGIEEGDFIDIGRNKNDMSFKIVWRHESSESESSHSAPKPSSYYKDKSEKTINPMYYGIDFDKNKILVIGCEPRKRYYKEAIEACNGEFEFCSGEEQIERILSKCSDSAAVVIVKDFLAHPPVYKIVEHCKDNEIPFKAIDGLGIKTVIYEARKLLSPVEQDTAEGFTIKDMVGGLL